MSYSVMEAAAGLGAIFASGGGGTPFKSPYVPPIPEPVAKPSLIGSGWKVPPLGPPKTGPVVPAPGPLPEGVVLAPVGPVAVLPAAAAPTFTERFRALWASSGTAKAVVVGGAALAVLAAVVVARRMGRRSATPNVVGIRARKAASAGARARVAGIARAEERVDSLRDLLRAASYKASQAQQGFTPHSEYSALVREANKLHRELQHAEDLVHALRE